MLPSRKLISFQSGLLELSLPVPKYLTSQSSGGSAGDAVAPMPGVIDKVYVQPGNHVEEGQPMAVMIAMKMEVGKPGVVSSCCIYSEAEWSGYYVLSSNCGSLRT